MSADSRGEFIVVGAVWRHKRDYQRAVTITAVERGARVHVKRNTSNRTQPILITTLLRNYKFDYWIALSTLEVIDRRADRLNELHRGELE